MMMGKTWRAVLVAGAVTAVAVLGFGSAANGTEPEHPAPVLNLTKAGVDASPSAVSVAPVAAKATGDGTACTFAITGAILGLLGLILGALALIRTRRPSPPTA